MKKGLCSLLIVFMMVIGTLMSYGITSLAEEEKAVIKINETTLEFDNIVYVDIENGDDDNTGDFNNPLATYKKAIEVTKNGDAIVFFDGEYQLTNIWELMAYERSYIGLGTKAVFSIASHAFPDAGCQNVNFYRLTFKTIQSTYGYFVHISGYKKSYINFNMYNCFFDDSGNFIYKTDGGMMGYFIGDINSGNKNTYSVRFENCSSNRLNLFNSLNDGAIGVTVNNHASQAAINGGHGSTYSILNSLTNVAFELGTCNITSENWKNAGGGTNPDGSQAHIGVYGGPFAWGDYKEEVEDTLEVVLEPTEQLLLSVDDEILENEEVNWESSDPTIASVDANGKLTAHAVGKTVITVTNDTGSYTEEINVLVVESADDYRLAVDLKVGEKCRLTFDGNTKTKKVSWVSADTSIATVTSKGKVKAVSKGLVMITATDDKNKEKQVYVRIR